jgi:hypothetical protein
MTASSAQHAAADVQPGLHPHGRHLVCGHCEYTLECVDQSRRTGTWLGSFICPNCRSEYFYAYRWGRLVKKM